MFTTEPWRQSPESQLGDAGDPLLIEFKNAVRVGNNQFVVAECWPRFMTIGSAEFVMIKPDFSRRENGAFIMVAEYRSGYTLHVRIIL